MIVRSVKVDEKDMDTVFQVRLMYRGNIGITVQMNGGT